MDFHTGTLIRISNASGLLQPNNDYYYLAFQLKSGLTGFDGVPVFQVTCGFTAVPRNLFSSKAVRFICSLTAGHWEFMCQVQLYALSTRVPQTAFTVLETRLSGHPCVPPLPNHLRLDHLQFLGQFMF
jgi:hypothetical protein